MLARPDSARLVYNRLVSSRLDSFGARSSSTHYDPIVFAQVIKLSAKAMDRASNSKKMTVKANLKMQSLFNFLDNESLGWIGAQLFITIIISPLLNYHAKSYQHKIYL